MTLVPLLVAGAVTLEICVLIGLPLNFANIVAFPLLPGIGVAFKIYYVTAWRSGRTNLLQTSLTRAIFFSALTTATAFGSLWLKLSRHRQHGQTAGAALVTTLAAVLLFQPALMGKPRNIRDEANITDDVCRRPRPAASDRRHLRGVCLTSAVIFEPVLSTGLRSLPVTRPWAARPWPCCLRDWWGWGMRPSPGLTAAEEADTQPWISSWSFPTA